MQLEVDIPPSIGGGTLVMRELTAGEFEDQLKSSTRLVGKTQGDASVAMIDMQCDQCMLALVMWRGTSVPTIGAAKEAFWRALSVRERGYLVGIFEKLHNVPEEEINGFFAAAMEARMGTAKPPRVEKA
jgi:hypothetical protein